jgi:hypothetical protein
MATTDEMHLWMHTLCSGRGIPSRQRILQQKEGGAERGWEGAADRDARLRGPYKHDLISRRSCQDHLQNFSKSRIILSSKKRSRNALFVHPSPLPSFRKIGHGKQSKRVQTPLSLSFFAGSWRHKNRAWLAPEVRDRSSAGTSLQRACRGSRLHRIVLRVCGFHGGQNR